MLWNRDDNKQSSLRLYYVPNEMFALRYRVLGLHVSTQIPGGTALPTYRTFKSLPIVLAAGIFTEDDLI
jgi:hypothetical protein